MSKKYTENLISDGGIAVRCRICGTELKPLPSFIKKAGCANTDTVFAGYAQGIGRFFISDGNAVYVSGNGVQFVYLNSLAGTPFLTEDISGGIARAAVISGQTAVVHDGSSFKAFKYGADLKCGVMHCGRLFGADGATVYWSGCGGLEDWEQAIYGGGYLNLDPERGEVLDILKYGEKLVAVRKFGLTVLSMFGNTESFSVEITDTDCDEIYKGTARAVCGKLIFFSASGLKIFDGSTISRAEHGLADDVYSPHCSATFNGRYYLGCKSRFLNGGATLCFDPADGTASLLNVSADAMCAAENLYAYNSSGVYTLEHGGGYSFTRKGINFGTGGFKTITQMFIGGVADVEISNGSLTRKFTSASGKIRPRLRGKSFTVTVRGSSALKSLTATAEGLNEI